MFGVGWVLFAICVSVGPILLFTMAIVGLMWLFDLDPETGREKGELLRSLLLGPAAAFLSVLPVGYTAGLIEEWDQESALRYCDHLVDKLEKHKAETDLYPRHISAIEDKAYRPFLLRGEEIYTVGDDRESFVLGFGGWPDARRVYDSRRGYWHAEKYWDAEGD